MPIKLASTSRMFTPVALGAMRLANRVVMAPMTRGRAGPGDVPTPLMAEYYRQRASAGLIITEGTQPSRAGKGYWRTPGIHSAEQLTGWQHVAEAVHDLGGTIIMQLMHVGRVSVRANKDHDAATVAPSAVASRDAIPGPDGMPVAAELPRALDEAEIPHIVAEYAAAARNARTAGFDGVELHCASGYLPMQFLCTNSNRRNDRYGGCAVNRARFAIEALEAMSDAIGADRVGFRIFPGNTFNDMQDDDPRSTYAALLEGVAGLGLAYCHLIHRPTKDLDSLELLRRHWHGAIIANNDLDREGAEALLAAGVDAVSFGRPFISNPDLVERMRRGAPPAGADRATFYAGEARGYTDYPCVDAALRS